VKELLDAVTVFTSSNATSRHCWIGERVALKRIDVRDDAAGPGILIGAQVRAPYSQLSFHDPWFAGTRQRVLSVHR
jgi:hypothetical protein